MKNTKTILPILTAILLSSCTTNSTASTTLEQNIPSSEPTITNTIQKESTMSADINLKNQTIALETNFGTLNIKMLDDISPVTTENFIRLSAKGYYDGTKFHRMAVAPGFSIIQGGDPTATGRGGESIFGKEFKDEHTNSDKLPEIYGKYNGQYCVYQKGLIAMANAGPNTNGSQFFIMLDDTKLPPAYTIFGQIDKADFPVLDKILSEVQPDSPMGDGSPNKEIKILSASIKE